MRWSRQLANQTTPLCAHHAPPPYSCTAVRAFWSSGSSSVSAPSGDRRTSAERPPSAGRPSDQMTSGPSTASPASLTASATTTSEVIGVGQEPYGSTPFPACTDISLTLARAAHRRSSQPCHTCVKVWRSAGSIRRVRDFLSATRERVLIYDGGMGATLEQFDLSLEDDYRLPGRCHEALVLNRPDVIDGVHTSMLEAGAEVLETDTFQASRLKLSEWGLEEHTFEINQKAAEIARKAAGEHRFVAGSIGPTGFL